MKSNILPTLLSIRVSHFNLSLHPPLNLISATTYGVCGTFYLLHVQPLFISSSLWM